MPFIKRQGLHNASTAGPTAATIAVTGAVASVGDVALVTVSCDNGGGITVTVADDKGNTYTPLDSILDTTDNQLMTTFGLGGLTNGPSTWTATFSPAAGARTIVVDVYGGAKNVANPFDGHTGNFQATPGTGANAMVSTNITPTTPGDLIWGAGWGGAGTALPSAGTSPIAFNSGTQDNTVNCAWITTEDAVQNIAAAVQTTFTTSVAQPTVTFIVAVKPDPPPPVLSSPIKFHPFALAPWLSRVQPVGTPAAAVIETNIHWQGQTYAPQWNRNKALLLNTAQDFSSSAVETNPHWQARSWVPQWSLARALLNQQHIAADPAIETNPNWKARSWAPQWVLRSQNSVADVPPTPAADDPTYVTFRTLPVQWLLNRALGQNTAQDFSSSAVETNPHWIGKPWPVQWVVNASLVKGVTGDVTTVVTTPDAPPPFIPRTWLPQWIVNLSLRQNTAQDFSASDVETNPHWQGRLWPVVWSRQAALLQSPASDAPFAVIDTPAYFIPRSFPVQWLLNRALAQGTAQDFSSSAVETNVQFQPRTWPPQWALQISLLRGTAQDFSSTAPVITALPESNPFSAMHNFGRLGSS